MHEGGLGGSTYLGTLGTTAPAPGFRDHDLELLSSKPSLCG